MMRKALILVAAVAIAAAPLRNSMAGDKEWAVAGKVMAGLAALAIISDAVADHHHVGVPAFPARRVIHVRAPRQVWVEGRYVEVVRKVWVPGHFERRWVPAVRGRAWVTTRYGGYWQETIVRPGFYREVWCPGQFIERSETEWIPGHWEEI